MPRPLDPTGPRARDYDQIVVRLPPALGTRLRRRAAEEGEAIAVVIREAVRRYLDAQEAS